MHKGRIIFGNLKRRIIELPDIKSTRPTTDSIKESIFNCLIHRFKLNFSEWSVIDLFAGSGALGIEAASLGAKEVLFCEVNYKACKTIYKNILNLKLEFISKIVKCDAKKLKINKSSKLLVIMDPPYEETDLLISQIKRFKSIKQEYLIVIETIHPEIINQFSPCYVTKPFNNISLIFIESNSLQKVIP